MLAIIILCVAVFAIVSSMLIVPEGYDYFVAGRGIVKSGLHFRVPFAEKVVCQISLTKQSVKTELFPAITKDNVTMQISVSAEYIVKDSSKYYYFCGRGGDLLTGLLKKAVRNVVDSIRVEDLCCSCREIEVNSVSELGDSVVQIGVVFTGIDVVDIKLPEGF